MPRPAQQIVAVPAPYAARVSPCVRPKVSLMPNRNRAGAAAIPAIWGQPWRNLQTAGPEGGVFLSHSRKIPGET